jgi:putative hemolysin
MDEPFEARLSYAEPDDPLLKRSLIRTIEWLTGRPHLIRLYRGVRNGPIAADTFWKRSLDTLGIQLEYNADRLDAIPRTGPLLLIANHPFGVVDGLSLCHFASRLRDRYQMLTNSILCQDPLLAPHLLPVDFNETREALRTNIATRNEALRTLEAGGALVIFPGGGISTSQGWFGPATDLPWKRFTSRLVQAARTTVVPFFFHGQNSRLFQIVSQFSLNLRLALLLREACSMKGRTVHVSIGDPIPFADVQHIRDRQQLLDALRDRTYALGVRIRGRGAEAKL